MLFSYVSNKTKKTFEIYQIQSDAFTQRDAIEEASYLMNLAIKELADTKFEVLL